MDLFRCRCYQASLQGGEPPNPKRLLGFASRPTKLAMGRLGIFSVSSFHALVLLKVLMHPLAVTHLVLNLAFRPICSHNSLQFSFKTQIVFLMSLLIPVGHVTHCTPTNGRLLCSSSSSCVSEKLSFLMAYKNLPKCCLLI